MSMNDEIEKCTSCGFCQAACPVFGATLRAAFNARGKMLLLQEMRKGYLEWSEEVAETFLACTTCRACTYSCPRLVKGAEVMEDLRRDLYKKGLLPREFLSLEGNIESKGNIYGLPPNGRIEAYPRELRELAERHALKPRAEVLLYPGCLPAYMDMRITPSLIRLLEHVKADYTVLGPGEICCGLPLHLMGSDAFAEHAGRVSEQIRATGARTLLTPCAGCYRTFSRLYPPVADLGMEVLHTVQYLNRLPEEERIRAGRKLPKRITYHDPCDLGRACGIFEEPRAILKRIPGVELVEMEKNRMEARCCGGGGGVTAHHPDLAVDMAARRVQDALDIGAEGIVSGCPACKDNLKKGALRIPREARGRIAVMDITETILAGVEESD